MLELVAEFAADPVAPHSGQFPLGRTSGAVDLSPPSPAGIRPWGLGGMRTARQQGDPVREAFTYDHDRQIAIDGKGRTLPMAATAVKDTNNDGDEGPSEDYSYDFCPDSPYSI